MAHETVDSDGDFQIELFRPEDAQGIVHLFEAVYGQDYPIKLYYDPEKLIQANLTGECHSIVARTPGGQVIGNHNLIRSALYEGIYEWAAGLVLNEYRSYGVTGRIVRHMLDDLVPGLGMEEVYGEPTCTQVHIQKMSVGLGFIETAMELALMPMSLYSKEAADSARAATLLQFRCYKPKPQTVVLPKVYEEELRLFYSVLDDERTLVFAEHDGTAQGVSEIRMKIYDFAQVARIAVHRVGHDFRYRFAEFEKEARDKNIVAVQVWLPADSDAVCPAVDILRGAGYFIGGILPRWFDIDGLLMQKIWCDPDLDSIVLYTDRARDILRIVAKDWTQAVSGV